MMAEAPSEGIPGSCKSVDRIMAEAPTEGIPGSCKSVDRICILHIASDIKDDDVKEFDENTWETVKRASNVRKEKFKSSKYTSICEKLQSLCRSEKHGYHRECYKRFTSVPKIIPEKETCEERKDDIQQPLLRSKTCRTTPTISSTGVLQPVCIFCNRSRKKRQGKQEGLGSCETHDAQAKIKNAATLLKDEVMLSKIGNIDFIAKEVKYHHSCRKSYLNDAERQEKAHKSSPYAQLRDLHEIAFKRLCEHISTFIIHEGCAELLSSLKSRYLRILMDLGEYDSSYTSQKLCEKILTHFSDKLRTHRLSNRGTVVYANHIDINDAINEAFFALSSTNATIVDAALQIRSAILHLQENTRPLPQDITVETLCAGEADAPEELLTFFQTLYTGSHSSIMSPRVARYVQSSADDAVFAATRGRVKPAKHISLGLGIKSMTGSRKVLDILNHFGHCISYNVAEALETDMATTVVGRQNVSPDGIVQEPGLSTGTAWDNYDENTETLSGQGTLHDTVGICYQNALKRNITPTNLTRKDTTREDTPPMPIKRKRKFDSDMVNPIPYPKKPRISTFNYSVRKLNEPSNLNQIRRRDTAWAVSCVLFNDTPMWSGWNSRITEDKLPFQIVRYMENLNLPPTRLDVVAETMRRSQTVTKECGDTYTLVTYDLAIAKPAMQIQDQESPKYDDMFICFGAFHIMMAYFASLGHFIDESGGPHILVDTEVLAVGSLRGFIAGKHFNRCKRLHPLLATAFQVLHFQSFLKISGSVPDNLQRMLHNLKSAYDIESLEMTPEYITLMDEYEHFTNKTRSGCHGTTARYWILYIDLVHTFLQFSRACRSSDLELFTYSLGEMCSIFFATNRHNYARYMVRYLLNLMNIDDTHPGLRQVLENGGLSIRRSNKSFSRNPVDMTLEQTVNADAASRLTGISAFSQSFSARRKWMITKAVRSAVVGDLQEKAGITKTDDTSQELKPYRIKRDNNDLQKLVRGIEDTLNPFGEAVNDGNLYCISTGKAAPDDVKEDLIHCLDKGKDWRDKFTAECFADPSRFEKPIPRHKIKNFTNVAMKVKVSTKDMKIREIQGTRDIFGRLLFLALKEKVDLLEVFKFPLTPVPMALAHIDGTVMKSQKSKLMHKLEGKVSSIPPASVDAIVVDGMFIIQSLDNVAPTYGAIAKNIMENLCRKSKRVDFVCDTYESPSIKDIERGRRGNPGGEINIIVQGPEQHRPKDFQQALRNSNFKKSFLHFLVNEWKDDNYAPILHNHELYFGLDKECYIYKEIDGHVICEKVNDLGCCHEEADSRIMLHLQNIERTNPGTNVIVRCNDTDILVILLYHVHNTELHIWMDVGHSGKNTRRYIDVTNLASHLGRSMCMALPGLHAFTGCDFTASFLRKGKVKPYAIVESSQEFQDTFSKLGTESWESVENISKDLEKFVCVLYGKQKINSVDEVRYLMFNDKCKPKDEKEPLRNIKGFNAGGLPPCQSVLKQKIRRSNYVALIWKNANKPIPTMLKPEDSGWRLQDGAYTLVWFEGEQIPKDICCRISDDKTLDPGDEESEMEQVSSDDSEYDSDTD